MIDLALSVLPSDVGPAHVKLVLEWAEPEKFFNDMSDAFVEHESVTQLKVVFAHREQNTEIDFFSLIRTNAKVHPTCHLLNASNITPKLKLSVPRMLGAAPIARNTCQSSRHWVCGRCLTFW